MSRTEDDISLTLMQLAADHVKGSSNKQDKSKYIIAIKNATLFGRILPVVEAYVRAPNENSAVAALSDSLKNLQLSDSSIQQCMDLLRGLRQEIHTNVSVGQEYFPTLSNLSWRVDITISSSVLSRVLEPSIILQLELSNGRKITFELSVSKFHKLRYTVASILKEMDHMNNKMSAIKT